MLIHQVAVLVTVQRTPSVMACARPDSTPPAALLAAVWAMRPAMMQAGSISGSQRHDGSPFAWEDACSRTGKRSRWPSWPSRRRAGPSPASPRACQTTSIRVAARTVVPPLPGPARDDIDGRRGRGIGDEPVGGHGGVAAAGRLPGPDVGRRAELGVGGGVAPQQGGPVGAGDLAGDRGRVDRRSPLGGGAHRDVDRGQQRPGRGVGEPGREAAAGAPGAVLGGDRQGDAVEAGPPPAGQAGGRCGGRGAGLGGGAVLAWSAGTGGVSPARW